MRFLIKVVLGMVLFNGLLSAFAVFFPNPTAQIGATNVTNSFSTYNPETGLFQMASNIFFNANFLIIFGIMSTAGVIGGGIMGVLSGKDSSLYIGISLIIALVAALYGSTIGIFSRLLSGYTVVNSIFLLTTIVIGIVFILSIADALAGRSDVD